MDILELFCRYFEEQEFHISRNESLIAENPKLMFNISGGVPFEKAISGEMKPSFTRVATIQSCLRTDSWNKIGISGRHHLAFKMLGHFSFYENTELETKTMMIRTAWDFLTEVLGIPQSYLAVTYHPLDSVTKSVWEKLDVTQTVECSENTNVNPSKTRSGFRTEILWDQKRACGKNCGPLCRCGRYIELWNIVFTQFLGADILTESMDYIAADSGMSLDRVVTAVENKSSDYENTLWLPVIERIESCSVSDEKDLLRRTADVGKATVLLLHNGITPRNKSQSYVLRKMIRELYLMSLKLSANIEILVSILTQTFTEDSANQQEISEKVEAEIVRFEKTLEKGRKVCAKILVRNNGELSKEDLELLSGTYGYPKFLALLQKDGRYL